MKSVKQIELILENCEVIDITNAVGEFRIEDISSRVSRVASNCIAKTLFAKMVFIQLYKDGEFRPHLFTEDTNPIQRLKDYKDITDVEITYDDNSNEVYYVDYDEGEDEGALGAENVNQQFIETATSLFILISSTESMDDFKLDEIDDSWFLNEDVKARIDLRNAGWKELFNNEAIYQAYLPSKKLNVSLDKYSVKIIKLDEIMHSFEMSSQVFKELLSYLFYTCEVKSTRYQEDFKYLDLTSVVSCKKDQTQIDEFNLCGHDIAISYEVTDDKFGTYEGVVTIDKLFEISITDMLSFMWILLKICE